MNGRGGDEPKVQIPHVTHSSASGHGFGRPDVAALGGSEPLTNRKGGREGETTPFV